MSQQAEVTLDRAQREALRDELELYASGWGDIAWGFRHGDREDVQRCIRRLRRLVVMMDAIGWSEQPDTPDTLPVLVNRAMAAWSRHEAKSLVESVGECADPPSDRDLDAYVAFTVIAEAVR